MDIKTPRLLIREFRPDDVVDIHRIATTDGFIFYNLDGSEETALAFVERAILLAQQPLRHSFKMAVEKTDKPGTCIGYVAFDQIYATGEGEPDIGYLMDPAFQRQGFATEAMRALMEMVFEEHSKLNDVWLTVHPDNIASQTVASRLGFQKIGKKLITTARGDEPRYVYQTNRFLFGFAQQASVVFEGF
jgi:RimJ/RimL family protein N-acetyltransferase